MGTAHSSSRARVLIHGLRIASRSRVANAISVGRDDVRLDSPTLIGVKASAVLVTSPQLLTTAEVDVLDRFVRLRGGPSSFCSTDARRARIRAVVAGAIGERHEAKPVDIGDLKAAEIIVSDPGLAGTIIAATEKDAVVVSTALGHGRIVVSGASDAWRYRADGVSLHSFWRALVVDAIAAAGDPLTVALSTERRVRSIRWRRGRGAIADAVASGLRGRRALELWTESTPIRLWPSGANRFAGRVTASEPGQCRVIASATGLDDASAPLSIQGAAVWPGADRDDLSPAVRAGRTAAWR